MSLVGYPDFQEQAQWQSPPAVIYSAAIANGATKTFPTTGNNLFNVSNWANTQLRVFGQSSILDVECQWYDADPPTALLGHRYWSTSGNGSDTNVNIPNCGPYLRVNVTNLSGAAPTLVAVIAFSNRVSAPFVCPSSDPIISTGVVSVGATTATAIDGSYLYAGPAFAWGYSESTDWSISIQSISSNGTLRDIMVWNRDGYTANQRRYQPLILPPRPVRVLLFNNDAVPRNLNFTLTGDVFR